MQKADSDLVRQHEVEEALIEVIRTSGGTEEEVQAEAQRFLQRVRERGGIFVSRVGDYFGFMHRTFQEYFAARYLLNRIKVDRQQGIAELVHLAGEQDALWREPFLLAVAYQSKENEHIACEILSALLARPSESTFEQEVSIVSLATSAMIEAKPLTIRADLQKETAERLLTCYQQALRARNSAMCKRLEDLARGWLLSLPKEAHRPPLLDVLTQAIKDIRRPKRQRAVLTLLALIAQGLEACPVLVFATVIPLLLALTGQPGIDPYHPATDLAPSLDLNVADMALCVLTFLGRRSPSRQYLEIVRAYFEKQPEQLRLLARYSLERGTLITPTMVPLAEESYRQYEAAVKQWLELRKHATLSATEQQMARCFKIQPALLATAEEASYPATRHLLAMVSLSAAQPEQPWMTVWQAYLLEQLHTGNYIDYQEVALLWNILFPKEQLHLLVDNLRQHYVASDSVRRRYAQRFIIFYFLYWENWGKLGKFDRFGIFEKFGNFEIFDGFDKFGGFGRFEKFEIFDKFNIFEIFDKFRILEGFEHSER